MTIASLIPPAVRSALLIFVGSALMVVPLITGMQPEVVLTAIAIGGIQVAVGIAGTDSEGRGTLPMSAQAVFDRGLALALLAAGTVYAAVGDQLAALLFGVVGLVALLVTVTTRYSVRPI